MGAGNRYMLNQCDETHALFIADWQDDCEGIDREQYDFLIRSIKECLLELPLVEEGSHCGCLYYGDSYEFIFEFGNHGEIVINFDYMWSEPTGLHTYNYARSYNKAMRHLNKTFELSIGFGWMSGHYEKGELLKEWRKKKS